MSSVRHRLAHAAAAVEAPEDLERFARDVREGLGRRPKQLSPRYLYDALGSRLFDAICALPWYEIPRAELRLFDRHGAAIMRAFGATLSLVDIGCGNGDKTARVARLARAARRSVAAHLVDVSPAALEVARRALARVVDRSVTLHRAAYDDAPSVIATAREAGEDVLVLFLGSNIGNFDPTEARAFLSGLGRALRPSDGMLVGVDLVKPEPLLRAAYDDPLGVTAAFNRNLLVRMNHELGADFRLDAFDHAIRWDASASRIEMHLVSRCAQRVSIPAARCTVDFVAGESIWTESSYKYRPDDVTALGESAGLTSENRWIDRDCGFALALFRPAHSANP